jgi:branched-chain amino acid transport system substrate-binding protein
VAGDLQPGAVVSKLRIGLSLSLSGQYAAMGRQAEAALRLFVGDTNQAGGIRAGGKAREVSLECFDDASDPNQCAGIYRSLCFENRADLVLGPYSTRLARAAAPIAEQAAMVMLNHGGAGDDLYQHGYRMLAGVLTPASEYMEGFVRLLAGLKLWRKRLAIVAATGSGFAGAVTRGVERACAERYARRKGVKVRVKYTGAFDADSTPAKLFPALGRNRVNALLSAGGYEHDVAVMRAIAASALNIPVLACVGAGVAAFGADLGEHAEGIVGPSQWEEQVRIVPEMGPTPKEFSRRMSRFAPAAGCDYPAAQAYAAALLAKAAVEAAQSVEQRRVREALSDLRTTTLFGDFAIDRVTGRQIAHKILLVQWHGGHKVVIQPESHADVGSLEFPSGWRLILASMQMLKLRRRENGRDPGEEDEPDEHGEDDEHG